MNRSTSSSFTKKITLIPLTLLADLADLTPLSQTAIKLEEHAEDKLVIFAGYGGTDVDEKIIK